RGGAAGGGDRVARAAELAEHVLEAGDEVASGRDPVGADALDDVAFLVAAQRRLADRDDGVRALHDRDAAQGQFQRRLRAGDNLRERAEVLGLEGRVGEHRVLGARRGMKMPGNTTEIKVRRARRDVGARQAFVQANAAAHLAARMTTAAAGVLGVLATYRLGRVMAGARVGIVAALLLTFSYAHVRDSHFATADVLLTLLATLALGAIVRASETGRWRDSRSPRSTRGSPSSCHSSWRTLIHLQENVDPFSVQPKQRDPHTVPT